MDWYGWKEWIFSGKQNNDQSFMSLPMDSDNRGGAAYNQDIACFLVTKHSWKGRSVFQMFLGPDESKQKCSAEVLLTSLVGFAW